MAIDQLQSLKMQAGFTQMVRMKQANVLHLPDAEFHDLISEVEKDPLFRRLYRREKLIHYRRFPGSGIYPRFYQLDEDTAADKGYLDIESLLLNRESIVPLIERLGVEKFKRYFLFPHDGVTPEDTATTCGLDMAEVEAINSFVNDFAIMSEFYHAAQSGSPAIAYTRIASIDMCGRDFVIGYFSPQYARGRYVIDYSGFEALAEDDGFSPDEIREARKLLKKLELINHRKDAINNILQCLIRKQALYLESGNAMSLLPFSQKELAVEAGLAPSSVSRAIHARSVVTPWGEEVPLKHLLPTPRSFKKEMIGQLLRTEPDLSSDEAVRARLREKLGIAISRRSVAGLRKELKLPARGRPVKRKERR